MPVVEGDFLTVVCRANLWVYAAVAFRRVAAGAGAGVASGARRPIAVVGVNYHGNRISGDLLRQQDEGAGSYRLSITKWVLS